MIVTYARLWTYIIFGGRIDTVFTPAAVAGFQMGGLRFFTLVQDLRPGCFLSARRSLEEISELTATRQRVQFRVCTSCILNWFR